MTHARSLFVLLVILLGAIGGAGVWWWRRAPLAPSIAGVSLMLARDRAARLSDVRYDLALHVPPTSREPIRGRLTASFSLADRGGGLVFDFAQPSERLLGVTANGKTLAARIENRHILLPGSALVRGANSVTFDFLAGDEPLNRATDFLYSLFVPARAERAIPCFDQPDVKARWRLTLDVPAAWNALSNGREEQRTPRDGRVEIRFAETQPISTYLFAFAAGVFQVETAERAGRTYRMFHRETDPARVARNREAIFDLHASSLAWLEDYTTIPYAFGKFDFVLLPAFQFSGMEHPGAVFYNANTLLLDESATQNQFLARANTIAHETAHMWFGDLVTMRWFNDVWMKEVFANLIASKIVNPAFPGINHELRFLLQNYPGAYEIDRTEGTNPIRQDLDNLEEAGSLYGAIIYQKAPIVMRQLEAMVGAEVFRDGLREYLRTFKFGNADWTDLVTVLDAKTPSDLAAWSRAWVDEPGRPTISTDLRLDQGKIAALTLKQADARGRAMIWPERLQVLVGSTRAVQSFDIVLDSAERAVPEATGLAAPSWVLPVGAGLGYGLFDLDAATSTYLTTSLHRIADPLTRGAALVAMWEQLVDGRVDVDAYARELLTAVAIEPDELNVQEMLADLRAIYWRFTPADDRPALAKAIEPVLRRGLDRATTTSTRAAWLSAIRSLATSDDMVGWLERLWGREVKIPGLPLSEVDESNLACDLALRDVPNAKAILDAQLARFTNPDRRDRFVFLLPALSGDVATRDKFFASLADVNNRRREAWVVDAMRYLNHPLRAATSKKYVRPALGLVQEIQRTGDIFFPKNWADASLLGYQSIQTAAEVRAIIDALPPTYPTRLRWVLLSSADPLFRAAKVINR